MIIKQDIRPNKMIWVTFRKEGIHKYPAAATDPNLATGDEYDVSFLATPHRHIFHFRVWLSVTHNDRDVEFISVDQAQKVRGRKRDILFINEANELRFEDWQQLVLLLNYKPK